MASKGNPPALCEALEPRLFLSGSAWLDYLAESGQPLALVPLDPSTVGGAIVQAGEDQVYRFSAPGTGRLTVQVASDGSGLDPFLQIYNAEGACLSQNDNARRGTLDSAATIWVSAGKVVSNIPQPPSGCCRTAVEISLDGVADTRDVKGFHQHFILGNLERQFKAYGRLAGIPVSAIA